MRGTEGEGEGGRAKKERREGQGKVMRREISRLITFHLRFLLPSTGIFMFNLPMS